MDQQQAEAMFNSIKSGHMVVSTVLYDDEPTKVIAGFVRCPNPECKELHMVPLAILVNQEMLDNHLEPLPTEEEVI